MLPKLVELVTGKLEAKPPVLAVWVTVAPSALVRGTALVEPKFPPIASVFWPGVVNDSIPKRAPSSLPNFSSAMTKRDSIITCLTGISTLSITAWISCSFRGVSLINSVLVLGSEFTEPRMDRIELMFIPLRPPPRPPPPPKPPPMSPLMIFLKSSAFWYFNLNTSVTSGSSSSTAFDASSAALSFAATSSAGATVITLPTLRIANALFCIIMSSAWSQGTSFSLNVKLPATVSLATILRPVNSAITCKTERTSTSWKLSDSFSPL